MGPLQKLLVRGDDSVPLDAAALDLARFEYSALDPGPFLEILDSHARELAALAPPTMPGKEFVETACHYFFEILGFRGNEEDYYSPRNSCLNEVLLNRSGIPITLAVVFLEVCRRLGRPAAGIGLPGHFVARYSAPDYTVHIDCYNRGRLLTLEECRELALETSRVDIFVMPSVLEPNSNRQIITRMLNNLRNVYYRSQQFEKGLTVLNLLLIAEPNPDDYKLRGLFHVKVRRPRKALEDLQAYLKLAPHASDRAEVEDVVVQLREYLQSFQ